MNKLFGPSLPASREYIKSIIDKACLTGREELTTLVDRWPGGEIAFRDFKSWHDGYSNYLKLLAIADVKIREFESFVGPGGPLSPLEPNKVTDHALWFFEVHSGLRPTYTLEDVMQRIESVDSEIKLIAKLYIDKIRLLEAIGRDTNTHLDEIEIFLLDFMMKVADPEKPIGTEWEPMWEIDSGTTKNMAHWLDYESQLKECAKSILIFTSDNSNVFKSLPEEYLLDLRKSLESNNFDNKSDREISAMLRFKARGLRTDILRITQWYRNQRAINNQTSLARTNFLMKSFLEGMREINGYIVSIDQGRLSQNKGHLVGFCFSWLVKVCKSYLEEINNLIELPIEFQHETRRVAALTKSDLMGRSLENASAKVNFQNLMNAITFVAREIEAAQDWYSGLSEVEKVEKLKPLGIGSGLPEWPVFEERKLRTAPAPQGGRHHELAPPDWSSIGAEFIQRLKIELPIETTQSAIVNLDDDKPETKRFYKGEKLSPEDKGQFKNDSVSKKKPKRNQIPRGASDSIKPLPFGDRDPGSITIGLDQNDICHFEFEDIEREIPRSYIEMGFENQKKRGKPIKPWIDVMVRLVAGKGTLPYKATDANLPQAVEIVNDRLRAFAEIEYALVVLDERAKAYKTRFKIYAKGWKPNITIK